MEQKKKESRLSMSKIKERAQKLNEMYNQNIASEDSQKTSFIYHKILAIEFVIALFSVVSIFISLMLQLYPTYLLSQTRCKYLLIIFTGLTIVAIFLQTKCRVKWNDEKRQPAIISFIQYGWWLIESIIILPIPNSLFPERTALYNHDKKQMTEVDTDALFTVYLLLRSFYVLKFIVHSESYYGSRPDRLSRLYAVRFGTFNAVKYLINEKPFFSLLVIYLMLFLELPLALYIIEGNINPKFSSYSSCIYFAVISMSTVGYGDTNSVTWIGRLLAVLMIVLGNCFTSLVLIFIIRSITFSSTEEDAHFLRGQLEVKEEMRKALVRRIEQEWRTKHAHCCAQEKVMLMHELKNFRLENRRLIHSSKTEPGNLKRLMLKNFSELLQEVQSCRDKQQLLRQYCDVIEQSEKHQHKTMVVDAKRSEEYSLLEEKIINGPGPMVAQY